MGWGTFNVCVFSWELSSFREFSGEMDERGKENYIERERERV